LQVLLACLAALLPVTASQTPKFQVSSVSQLLQSDWQIELTFWAAVMTALLELGAETAKHHIRHPSLHAQATFASGTSSDMHIDCNQGVCIDWWD